MLGTTRTYRALLPPEYENSQKRYPVLYWFPGTGRADAQRESEFAAYAAKHDLIVVDVGPADMVGQFVPYFPELVENVDQVLRTLADRAHRGVSGASTGGFAAYWIAAKYPGLIGSASNMEGTTESSVGPNGIDLECALDDLAGNLEGVRTRLVHAPADSMGFYHRRLDSIWKYTRPAHESEAASPLAKTLDFHMAAFANPLPVPVVFQHADAYPNFIVWGWEVLSDRQQPGFMLLENVSSTGLPLVGAPVANRRSLPFGSEGVGGVAAHLHPGEPALGYLHPSARWQGEARRSMGG